MAARGKTLIALGRLWPPDASPAPSSKSKQRAQPELVSVEFNWHGDRSRVRHAATRSMDRWSGRCQGASRSLNPLPRGNARSGRTCVRRLGDLRSVRPDLILHLSEARQAELRPGRSAPRSACEVRSERCHGADRRCSSRRGRALDDCGNRRRRLRAGPACGCS